MADSKVNLKHVAIGAIVIAALGFGISKLLSDEPPIKVRGGGLEIVIDSNDTESWVHDDDAWRLEAGHSGGGSTYKFKIALGKNCGSSGQTPSTANEVTIALDGKRVQIKRHGSWFSKKTKVKPKGDFVKDGNDEKILRNSKTGAVTVSVKPGVNANEWSCTFPDGQFQYLCLYTTGDCS
jgi:hypothetical protein